MSKYIDADLYVEMQIYDDEHEEWEWWKGTIEDLLDQWTEEGCPSAIEVSEDCVDRKALLKQKYKAKDIFDTEYEDWFVFVPTIENAPSVVPSRAEGEWIAQGDCGVTKCNRPTIEIVECGECRWRDDCSQTVANFDGTVDTIIRWCSDGERIEE